MACSGGHCTNHGIGRTYHNCAGHRGTCNTNAAPSWDEGNVVYDKGRKINHSLINDLRVKIRNELTARRAHSFYNTSNPPAIAQGEEIQATRVRAIADAQETASEIRSRGSTARYPSPNDNDPRTLDDDSNSHGNYFTINWEMRGDTQSGDLLYGKDIEILVKHYDAMRRDCICHTDCACNAVCTCHNNCGCHY